jgi:hypothetical protein
MGAAFWVGPKPTKVALTYGTSLHERDWTGPASQQYDILADVVVFVSTLDRRTQRSFSPFQKRITGKRIKEEDRVHCDDRECYPRMAVVPVAVTSKKALRLSLRQGGRSLKRVVLKPKVASTFKPGALPVGFSGLYRNKDEQPLLWLVRPPDDVITAIAPTSGNCRYSFSLPPGRYRVTAWHQKLRPIHHKVRVHAGRVEMAHIHFSRKNLPTP